MCKSHQRPKGKHVDEHRRSWAQCRCIQARVSQPRRRRRHHYGGCRQWSRRSYRDIRLLGKRRACTFGLLGFGRFIQRAHLRKTENVVIHLLSADQVDLAKLCAKSGVDRFADTSLWDRLPSGEPYFPTTQAWILGRAVNRMPAGGATVLAVHALEASEPEGDFSPPLVYHNRRWHSLGDHSTLTV
jgi:hypothetical protein